MIHLDTNFLIGLSQHSFLEDGLLRRWLGERRPLGTSSVAWAEFLCGPLQPGAALKVRSLLGDPVPFTADDAARAAELFNATWRRRGSLNDCMIAAVALRAEASLATRDVDDFARFATFGLRMAD